ncbi:MAG: pyridoxamine 5'-phosphate oxidase [Leptospirales bacterium]|nr:pyridoxamine 5'-phosphate oxidase [Leptospirales bacterium]
MNILFNCSVLVSLLIERVTTDPASLRREYTADGLTEEAAGADPYALFDLWFQRAAKRVAEPNAMTLSTSTRDGFPSSRIVLLKGYDARGLVFYTNYDSRKGKEIEENPNACLLFFWQELEQQIRIEGPLSKTSREESESYFESRPLESRIGAHASAQSSIISGRQFLIDRVKEIQSKYGERVPLPDNWGGYRLAPTVFEFWQGGVARLHDRIRFRMEKDSWIRERLSP